MLRGEAVAPDRRPPETEAPHYPLEGPAARLLDCTDAGGSRRAQGDPRGGGLVGEEDERVVGQHGEVLIDEAHRGLRSREGAAGPLKHREADRLPRRDSALL
jgi:hypothetical protein